MIVYKATNTLNNKVYIGQTIQRLYDRKSKHIYKAFNSDEKNHFYNAIRKYSVDAFLWEIIDEAKTIEELNAKEIYWINKYNSIECGYNTNEGGKNRKLSKVHKKKISDSLKGHKLSKDTRNKISQTVRKHLRDNGHPLSGKPISKGHKIKLQIKVRKLNPKTKEVLKDYKSITEASEDLGCSIALVSLAVNYGKLAKGYIFERI